MASPSVLRAPNRPNLYVCARCTFRASQVPIRTARRSMASVARYVYSDKRARNVATAKSVSNIAAEHQWSSKAQEIKEGKRQSMLSILEERGLVNQITGTRDAFDETLTTRRVGVYVGIDPTGPSLHVGHMVPLMALFWMHLHGYRTVSLIGGATAKIGDPTDRLKSREKSSSTEKQANLSRMEAQLKRLWGRVDVVSLGYGYRRDAISLDHAPREVANNANWWNTIPMLEVLQYLGPSLRLGTMLARDTVKNKMTKGDGMSYAEFSYPIMQAWDWWHMFYTRGISMQIGGSDQFGNITAGIDAVKHMKVNSPKAEVRASASTVGEPLGLTVPLLTTSSGEKFGKSAGNGIFLDATMTAPFDLYKFFVGTADADVSKLLKMFTFMPIKDIDNLVAEHMQAPHERKAQHTLAFEFLSLIHGPMKAAEVRQQHLALFSKTPLVISEPLRAANTEAGVNTPQKKPKIDVTLPRSILYQNKMPKILLAAGISHSTTDAYRIIEAGGVYIGSASKKETELTSDNTISWERIANFELENGEKYLFQDNLLLFRKGKNGVRMIQLIDDEEYALTGFAYRGLTVAWKREVLEKALIREGIPEERKAKVQKELDKLEEMDRLEEEARLGRLLVNRIPGKGKKGKVERKTESGSDVVGDEGVVGSIESSSELEETPSIPEPEDVQQDVVAVDAAEEVTTDVESVSDSKEEAQKL